MPPYIGQTGGGYYGHGHGGYSNQSYVNQNYQGACHRPSQPRPPFLAMLNMTDFSRLMNVPVSYDPPWPVVPTNIPSEIPKFEGKPGEDSSEHVTTFHLCFSSNSLHEYSICLRIFQCTLIEPAVKWYIELPREAFTLSDDLAMTFLNHFQLPVRYDVGTELF